MSEKQQKPKVGALWKKETPTGKKLLSGEIEVDGQKIRVEIWPNGFKTEDKHPDYVVYKDDFVPSGKKDSSKSVAKPTAKASTKAKVEVEDDDIPF